MTLLELLRWLIETWPEVDGAAEWQAMTVRAASVGIAASRRGAPGDYKPEPMFAWWLTIFGTDEYAERCRRADAALTW